MTLLGPDDVAAAAAVLAGVAERTPVQDLTGDLAGLAVKREDRQPIGAFKLRGAYHAASRLTPERRAAGLVTHSSGNHGRALAWVARQLGVPCTVVAPDDAVAAKVAAMADLGARLVRVPADRRESAADAVVAETGATLVPPYDHRDVIAGQGTVGAEILADRPDVERVVVPVGGGGLISGIAAALRGSGVRVVGAEPTLAGDAAASKRAGERVRWPRESVAATAADGLRATVLGELTWPHVRDLVDEVVTVDEEAIADATRRLHRAGVPCEASGAVSTAAWRAMPPEDRARRTVAVVSGGNVDPAWLARVLADGGRPVPTSG
ncbi:serine/threonine dehydratase [Actinomycetospora sp. NBRC 106375]|uniref:threonine ammonia-lyase n=1 Tax=Actinomycetospora sp. NBRC 106375 TaxID=3032207 RepID=UPI0024A01217|nr:pyridoxal-phosphate dependent enzyme [Actinomycetospora sp. NBRC 106375]GLZ46055.1 serine/threonine dehydratase [Actinomycetospora sp. NBRC 106375]